MKTSLLSLVAAFSLLTATVAAAADHDHDNNNNGRRPEVARRATTADQARYEAAQRASDPKIAQERARYEATQRRENERRLALERSRLEAQRRDDQRKAAERARYEAQHRNDHRPDQGRDYGYNGHR